MSGVQVRVVARREADMRLDRWFKENFPDLGFGRLQKLLRTGQIRVDGKRVKAGHKLESGQEVRIPPIQASVIEGRARPKEDGVSPEDASLIRSLILFESDDLFVINKPAGLAVQGGAKTERHLDGMLGALMSEDGERPRLVHRLDRDTSGVMMLARTRQAATALSQSLRGKETRKIYWAITVGEPHPREGEISMALSKAGGPGQERVVADSEDGKSAITWYKTIDSAGNRAAIVALWPRTGRTHQLRAHMAELGSPVLSDGKYGGKAAFLTGDPFPKQLHLHAREIQIPSGVKGGGTIVRAELPEHLRTSAALLGLRFDDVQEDPFEGWSAPSRGRKRTGAQTSSKTKNTKSKGTRPKGKKPNIGKNS